MTSEIRTVTRIKRTQIALSAFDVIDLALVPRNTRGRLLRAHLSQVGKGSLLQSVDWAVMIVPWRAPDETGIAELSDEGFERMDPIYITQSTAEFVGVPANQFSILPHTESEIDFSKLKRRGVAVLSKGARSNERAGWSLLIWNRDATNNNIGLAVTLEWEMEWLGGKGSQKNLNIENEGFDEEENQ